MTPSHTTSGTGTVSPSSNGRGVQDIVHPNTNVSPIGVDTVRIHVEDFDVGDAAEFTIKEQSDYSTGETESVPLWRKSDGTVNTGNRAILNTSLAQVTVQSIDFMSVQSTLPKLLHGDNVRPVSTPAGIRQALEELEEHLSSEEIDCSLNGQPLARVDLCRNVRTDTPLPDLEPFLKRLDAPYLQPRDNGHDGIKWVSGQGGPSSEREITLYNKSEEAGLPAPRIQRLEYRLQRERTVNSKLGGHANADVTTEDLSQDLSSARSAFREIVKELFPDPPGGSDPAGGKEPNGGGSSCGGDEQITSSQIRQLLGKIRSEHGENCHALNRTIWPLLLSVHPDPDHLADALERAAASEDGPARGKYQVRQKTREARRHAQVLNGQLSTAGEHLGQLRSKLLTRQAS